MCDSNLQQTASPHSCLQLFCIGHKTAPEITGAQNHHICGNSDKVFFFLFNGFDEFPVELQESFWNSKVLEHHVLSQSDLVVSSRPHALENLHKETTLRVDILGCTETDFIKEALTSAELTKYFESDVIINDLCFIPFNIVTFIYLCEKGTSNSTQLCNCFVYATICRHLAKFGHPLDNATIDLVNVTEPYELLVHRLSELSFEDLDNNESIFTLEEMTAILPDNAANPDGFSLLQTVQYFRITEKLMTFSFLNFSIQEFLAAYHFSWHPPAEDLLILKEKFWGHLHSNAFTLFNFNNGFLSGGKGLEIFLKDQLLCRHLLCSFHETEHGNSHQLPNCDPHFNDLSRHLNHQNQHFIDHSHDQNSPSDNQSHSSSHQDDVKESIVCI